jgi:hypothetical protein
MALNENSQILQFWFIPGLFLGFLGILRNPEDSTRNWWGRVKTSTGGALFIIVWGC